MMPLNMRGEFFSWMSLHDVTGLETEDWLSRMLEAAAEFAQANGIDEDAKALLVFYCKSIGRKDFNG